jgi:hypothetical protein
MTRADEERELRYSAARNDLIEALVKAYTNPDGPGHMDQVDVWARVGFKGMENMTDAELVKQAREFDMDSDPVVSAACAVLEQPRIVHCADMGCGDYLTIYLPNGKVVEVHSANVNEPELASVVLFKSRQALEDGMPGQQFDW